MVKKLGIIAAFLAVASVHADFSHSIILDDPNISVRFFGGEGVCDTTLSGKCLSNEIWFGPGGSNNFKFGAFDRMRYQEIDAKTGQITYCELVASSGNSPYRFIAGNSHVRLTKGCGHQIWNPSSGFNGFVTWFPINHGNKKPGNWVYPAGQ